MDGIFNPRDISHIDKFNGTNFQQWKYGISLILDQYEIKDTAEGIDTSPTPIPNDAGDIINAEEIYQWSRKDLMAKQYIYSTNDSERQRVLMNCKTSNEMWLKLTTQYQQNASDNRHLLRNEFYSYTYRPGDSIMAHITAVETLAGQLIDVGVPVSDEDIISKIVCNLPLSYRTFQTTWASTNPAEHTRALLTTRLVNEERAIQRYQQAQQSLGATSSTSNNEALYSNSSQSQRGRLNRRDSGRSHNRPRQMQGDRPRCTYCTLPGHKADVCRTKKRDERNSERQGHGDRANTSQTERSTTEAEWALISAACLKACKRGKWYADSGATQHMSEDRSAFNNYQVIPEGTWTVDGIGNTKLQVVGKGDIQIESRIQGISHSGTIKNVLHVPHLGVNLISIAAMTSLGAEVAFIANKVNVTLNNQIVMTGERSGMTLYELEIQTAPTKMSQSAEKATTSNVNTNAVALKAASFNTWHKRVAHVNYQTIQRMMRHDAVEGIILKEKSEIPKEICQGCALGKMHKLPFLPGTRKVTEIGELVHSDVCGPMQTPTSGGAQLFVLFKDEHSSYRVAHLIKHKSEVPDKFREYVHTLNFETGKKVATLRSDNGGEFTSNDFESWLKEKHIRHETSVPHNPQQNGAAERDNRTIVESVRCIIHGKNLPLWLWGEALMYAIYTLNRTLPQNKTVTPYQVWHNKKPSVAHFREFGVKAYALIPYADRQKLDAKSKEYIMVGYAETQKAYRLCDKTTRKIHISRDVIFEEDTTVSATHLEETGPPEQPTSSINDMEKDQIEQPKTTKRSSPRQPQPKRLFPMEQDSYNTKKRKEKDSATATVSLKSLSLNSYVEPNHYQDALSSPDAAMWREAIEEEYQSLIENETWELAQLPKGRSVIDTRWTFKKKIGIDGEKDRYKARYCAKGFTQLKGIDYQETFSPVVKHTTLRTMLSIATVLDLDIIQLDVKTAFLHGEIEEETYIKQPEGYVIPGRENEVCRLKKCISGLKQSSRVWNQKFHKFLTSFGLKSTEADPCLYTRQDTDGIILVGIWVDDGLVCGSKMESINKVIEHLSVHFKMTSKPARHFVGLEITRDRQHRKTYVSIPNYIEKTLQKFNMANCSHKVTPADPHTQLSINMCPTEDQEKEEMKKKPYREAVGCLIYAAITVRPDISYAVGQVSRFCENPGKPHWSAVKHILSYLAGTKNHGICFSDGNSETNTLLGFCDSDYAGEVDTRRSTSGLIFKANNGPISWGSTRQTCIAQSTTEAEYVSLNEAAREAVWLRRLMNGINCQQLQPTKLFCDNQSAIRLAVNPELHKKTKHIEVKYHYVREQQQKKEIKIEYVPTNQQTADILTKPLAGATFREMRERLGVKEAPTTN